MLIEPRPLNRKERALQRWYMSMRMIRPVAMLIVLLLWVALAPPHIPLLIAMASGDVLMDGDGNVVLDDNGDVTLMGDDSAVCCCTHCSDCRPSAYILTISGVTACGAGCRNNCFFLGQSASVVSYDINGTFTLDYDSQTVSGSCLWLFETAAPTETIYNSLNCTGTVSGTSSTVTYIIEKAASGFGVDVGISACSTYFSGGFIAEDTCSGSGYTVSNNVGLCPGCVGGGTCGGGKNGTADWTPA